MISSILDPQINSIDLEVAVENNLRPKKLTDIIGRVKEKKGLNKEKRGKK